MNNFIASQQVKRDLWSSIHDIYKT